LARPKHDEGDHACADDRGIDALTRFELTSLEARIKGVLAELPEDAEDREIALTSLRNVRHVLALRNAAGKPDPC
jgi:hypothetical protein